MLSIEMWSSVGKCPNFRYGSEANHIECKGHDHQFLNLERISELVFLSRLSSVKIPR